MAGTAEGDDWLYHLSAFPARLRERDAHDVLSSLDVEFGGVLYHHRGVRVPAYNATFVWRGQTFELELDAVGSRRAWVAFDADRDWDFFLSRTPGNAPCLAWMTTGEFEAEESETYATKAEAVGMGRFSFGLYLQSPSAWNDVERRARESAAPFFIYRPSGRTLLPRGDLDDYADVVPPELLSNQTDPPTHVGLSEAHIEVE